MFQKLLGLLQMEGSYFLKFGYAEKKYDTERKQLIASLTKPLLYHYFHESLIKRSILKLHSPLSSFFETSLDISIEDLLTHRSGVCDYLELGEDCINQSGLDEICSTILKKSDCRRRGQYAYSNSGYVLLAKIIQTVTKRDYTLELAEYYKKFSINLSFDDNLSNYLAGWGDGAAICSIEDYLKFIALDNAEKAFDSHNGFFRYYAGSVPGIETLACFNPDFTLIHFVKNPLEKNTSDMIFDILEEHFKK